MSIVFGIFNRPLHLHASLAVSIAAAALHRPQGFGLRGEDVHPFTECSLLRVESELSMCEQELT